MVLRNKETAIQQAIPNYFPSLRKASGGIRTSNDRAHGLGHAEGRKINLHQVGGGNGSAQLR